MNVTFLDAWDPMWLAFLGTSAHDFYHLPGYVALEASRLGGRAIAILVELDGAQILIPLVLRPVDGSFFDGVSPYGYPGPLSIGISDEAFIGRALEGALPALSDAGIVSLFLRCHPIINPTFPSGPWTIVRHGQTVAIDLSVPDDEYFASLRRTHRQGIRHAQDYGQAVTFDATDLHLPVFEDLYRVTMERVEASPEYFFDHEYFQGLLAVLGDRQRIGIVTIDGDVAAACIFVETDGIVQYHLMGVDDNRAREAPTKILLHEARNWARDRGDRLLHLGGGVGAADDSLFHFKAGFSSLRYTFSTVRVVVNNEAYDRLSRERAPLVDPSDSSGFFPAYRSV